MTENIIEKGKAPDKTTEDTVMTTEPMTTEEGAREPSSKRWKKPHAYFERCRALAREKHRTCQERRRPRKVGIEVMGNPLYLQGGFGLTIFGYMIASPRA